MRIPIIAANWKMNKTVKEALGFVEEFRVLVTDVKERDIVLCPPFTSIWAIKNLLSDGNIKLGAQNVFWEEKGAFTGEISPPMLKELGCQYVIVGHSERRCYFGETDEGVNKKVKMCLNYGINPIICVGETLKQREQGKTKQVVETQVRAALKEMTPTQIEKVVFAYEPIWAIGTGKTDTPEEANNTIGFIRQIIEDVSSYEVSQKVRIQYGGSIKPDNIDSFMAQTHIDGGLVGGASLNAESFARIVKYQILKKV